MEFLTYRPLVWLIVPVILLFGFRYSLVDQPTRQRLASFALRCIGILLLIIAMCRPYWGSDRSDVHVVFLLDVSQSVDLGSAITAIDDIQQSIDQFGSRDSASLFLVGKGTRHFDDTAAMKETLDEWTSTIDDSEFRSESRLAEALRETRFAFPAGKASRVVLFSDGQETNSDVATVLRQLKDENTDVRIRQLAGLNEDPSASIQLQIPACSHCRTARLGRPPALGNSS